MANTVSVACKLPHGLHLQLDQLTDTPQGKLAMPVGARVTLNGGNHDDAVAGWGVTENVDKEFIDTWLARNKDLPFVKDGLIVVRPKVGDVIAEAKDKREKKTGLEQLDPTKKPKGITAIDKEDKE